MSFLSSSSLDSPNRYSRSPTAQSPYSTGSPRPGSAVLSRPQWPWAGSSNRSASSAAQSIIAPVPSPTPRLVIGSEDSDWAQQSVQGQALNMPEETSTRQWSFSAFEWTIKHVGSLRDHVEVNSELQAETTEGSNTSDNGADEDGVPLVLKQSPMIGENGENKFKVELARTPLLEDQNATPTGALTRTSSTGRVPTLSLYVTSLFLDFAHPEYEFCTAIMVAIKSREDRAGDRGARSDWVWEHWDSGFVFRKGSEYWECQLPPLSTLLTHSRIAAQDSLVLCIQIHSPIGFYPQFPQAYYVPKDLLAGLEASLDNPYTGDVRFVTLEWYEGHDDPTEPNTSHSQTSSSPSSQGRSSTSNLARKRTIYAHSDILRRRSDYFATMLASAFAESTPSTLLAHSDGLHPPRKIHDIIVSEADFVTIYWLCKWVYADWILFKDEDDPRAVMNGMVAGWSINSLVPPSPMHGHGEWDWRPLANGSRRRSAGGGEARSGLESDSNAENLEDDHSQGQSARSASSIGTVATIPEASVSDSGGKGKVPAYPNQGSSRGGAPSTSRGGRASVVGSSSRAPPTNLTPTPRRTTAPPKSPNLSVTVPPTSRSSSTSMASDNSTFAPPASAAARSSVSPQRARYPPSIHAPSMMSGPVPDPHAHPTPELPPASALAIYQIAHRYSLPGLQSLALEHMMNTITPQSAFPLLLATHFWEDLHGMVEDFVVDHFDIVSRCDIFDQCCEEIALGEWGPEGGRTLAGLFRRLSTVRYARA